MWTRLRISFPRNGRSGSEGRWGGGGGEGGVKSRQSYASDFNIGFPVASLPDA